MSKPISLRGGSIWVLADGVPLGYGHVHGWASLFAGRSVSDGAACGRRAGGKKPVGPKAWTWLAEPWEAVLSGPTKWCLVAGASRSMRSSVITGCWITKTNGTPAERCKLVWPSLTKSSRQKISHRMPPAVVIVLHGLGANRQMMAGLADFLEEKRKTYHHQCWLSVDHGLHR